MFAATGPKLRNRVQLEIAHVSEIRGILKSFHYLHRARVGRQINYAVLLDGVCDGVITYAYPMICASIAGVPSDEVLEFARLYLKNNHPHVASCAIGKSLRRLVDDWRTLYPNAKLPRLIVSYSDKDLHKGTIYKAANFRWLKEIKPKARGKMRYANDVGNFAGRREMRQDHWHKKDCWIYNL